MNIAILKGNITRDPEVKFLPSGAQITEFSVAISDVWYNDKKEKQERTHFFDCVAFGNTAKSIGDYFKKGKPILIEGNLEQDTWDDKTTGQKRSKVKIKVQRFEFCGGDRNESSEPKVEKTVQENRKPPVDPDLYAAGDDIPF